jgi:hypothetical protein
MHTHNSIAFRFLFVLALWHHLCNLLVNTTTIHAKKQKILNHDEEDHFEAKQLDSSGRRPQNFANVEVKTLPTALSAKTDELAGGKSDLSSTKKVEKGTDDKLEELIDMLPLARSPMSMTEVLENVKPINPDNPVDLTKLSNTLPSETSFTFFLSTLWEAILSLAHPDFYFRIVSNLLYYLSFLISPSFYISVLKACYRALFQPHYVVGGCSCFGYFYYIIVYKIPMLKDRKKPLVEIFISLHQFFDHLIDFIRLPGGPFIPGTISDFINSLATVTSYFSPKK